MAPRRGKQKKKPRAIKSGHLLIAGPGLSRVVHCNDSSENNYAGNYVRTTKYTLLSFLPKSLHEQFRRVANLYFLLIAILACTPLAPYSPLADTVPLVIVVGATMVKELVEDWRRKQQEKEVNNREVKLYYDGVFGVTEWKNLKVGDIVRVEKNEYFPADLILLSSSNAEAICYVETMNLDGETNLKLKQALDVTSNLHECSSFQDFDAVLRCEEPNANLYSFAGNLDIGEQQYPLTAQQLLLRDSKLRNTDCIHGVVVFTGHDTKVMQNSTAPPSKRSRIEKRMDILIYSLFLSLTALALFGSIWFGIATRGDLEDGRARWYLRPNETTVFFNPNEAPVAAVFHFLTVLMLYSYLIPISLYVSLEIVKVIQTTFINQDLEMYYEHTDKPAVARTSNLNEELGQVDTILSDKTGTLTCNLMEFIKFSVAGNSYGHGVTEVEKRMARRRSSCSPQRVTEEEGPFEELNEEPVTIKGFNFVDERVTSGHWLNEPHADIIQKFLRLLAVCHTAVPDIHEATGRITYEAESPDEAAFVIAARELGFECYARTRTSVSLHELDPVSGTKIERHYKLLNIIEFSSSRKRMSVIVRNEEGQLLLLCKGADSVMFERLALNGREFEGQTKEHISGYADAGLRTLVLAYRELTEEEYNEFSREFSKAKNSASADREEMIEKVALRFEKDLVLLGATAVEDRLQYGVPECIEKLSEAGIKIWVLTGDKMETAVNIGFACSLLRHEMRQIIISSERPEKESLEKMEDEVTAHVIIDVCISACQL